MDIQSMLNPFFFSSFPILPLLFLLGGKQETPLIEFLIEYYAADKETHKLAHQRGSYTIFLQQCNLQTLIFK